MVLKFLKSETTFSIGISSNSKWILNEKIEELYGLNLARISSCDFKIGSILDNILLLAWSDQLIS
jgi:hypothetical protein